MDEHDLPHPDPQTDNDPSVGRRHLRDRRTNDVVQLLARRRELAGLHRWADLVNEGVAWTA